MRLCQQKLLFNSSFFKFIFTKLLFSCIICISLKRGGDNISQDSSLTNNFVRALSYYQTVKGKRKKEVAAAIGVPDTTFSSWSNGTHLPNMEKLQILANYLDAPIEQFFNFSIPQEDKLSTELINLITELSDEDKNVLRTVALRLKQLQGEEP